MKITNIETFAAKVPIPEEEEAMGKVNSFGFVRIFTDEGITGYGFRAIDQTQLEEQVKPILIGQDPFAIEKHIKSGLLRWPAVEHALWDIVGKAAGMPVYKLLGGDKEKVKVYLTCVWRGKADQSDQTPESQAKDIAYYYKHGFRAVKIRIWRPDPMIDVEAVKAIKSATGPDMEVMLDRTAQYPGSAWDYETGYKAACALEEAGATWLEEPFYRGDWENHTRLSAAVGIPITGGEGDLGLEKFREYLEHRAFDIVQPDAINCGGILTARKISAMAESYGVSCILHGSSSLGLAGTLQISCAIPNARVIEHVFTTPPLLPWEQSAPVLKLLKTKELYKIQDGYIYAPQSPGLGIEINEKALEEYRIP